MKHIDNSIVLQPAHRLSRYVFAVLLLLVLIVMQSRVLALESLASQLLSVNESIPEQMLLPAANGDNDQPCIFILTAPHSLLFDTAIEPQGSRLFYLFAPRWVGPSTRAPPVIS